MAASITGTILLIRHCRQKVETVLTNKKTCKELAEDLEIIEDILTPRESVTLAKTESERFQRVLKKLDGMAKHAEFLFERCQSNKTSIKIRNYLSSTSIREKLKEIHDNISVVINMLLLVFHIEPDTKRTRGGIELPQTDESIFDKEFDDKYMEEPEEYYEDTEN